MTFAQAPVASATDSPPEACDVLESISDQVTPESVAAATRLLIARGDPDVAASIVACLTQPDEPADPEVSPKNLGEWWAAFEKNVIAPLTAPVAFVGAYALILIALGRLFALVPRLRDPNRWNWQQRKITRDVAWVSAVVLSIGVPSFVALRGIWVMARGGPSASPVKAEIVGDKGFGALLAVVANMTGGVWFMALAVSLLTVFLWSFVFATLPRVTLKLKGTDKGLDASLLMATIDAMAGGRTRGLEFPVGTDITTAADGVKQVSDNKAVAMLQAALKAVFGTTPWELSVENESEGSASISISRNGVLVKAKRIRLFDGHPLAAVTEVPAVERLAGLVAGELIAAMRTRYSPEFDPKLHGATDGESIGLQFLASSALTGSRETRAKAVPVLARAVEADPGNRAAWATLANFVYRDPENHRPDDPAPHAEYRRFLKEAIENELSRSRTRFRSRPRLDVKDGAPATTMPTGAQDVNRERLRGNALLPRLCQAFTAASANLRSIEVSAQNDGFDDEVRWLQIFLLSGKPRPSESRITAVRRRQLLMVDEFRQTTWSPGQPLEVPPLLTLKSYKNERDAWRSAKPGPQALPTVMELFACEDAALAVSGDFSHDPVVAYAVACYRVTKWLSDPSMLTEAL